MPKLDLEPLDLEPVDDKKSKLDLQPLDLEPVHEEPKDLATESAESNKKVQEGISAPESFGQGMLQGSTAGFSDELGGALGAGMEKLAGNPDNKSLEDLYKEYRDFQRKRNSNFEQANPKSSLAGNVAGAITTGALIPGSTSIGGATALGAAQGLGSSDADLTSGASGDMVQAAKDTAVGGGLGLGAGVLGKGIQKLLNPQALETAGSKMATSVVGKPSKELTTEWAKEGDKYVAKRGSDVIKGLGKTASDEGALPAFGGADSIYDKTIEAVTHNEAKLNPLLQRAQSELGENVEQHLDQIGHVGDKVGSFANDFIANIPDTSKKEALIRNIFKTYGPKIEEISNADGDLVKLNELKREFFQSAKELNKGAFNNPDAQNEAQFAKQVGGVIRQHIEDLADSANVDKALGQELKQTNKTLSNLYTYEDMAKKALDKGSGSFNLKNLGMDYAYKTGQKLAAKGTLGAAKMVDTPAGQLVQKAAPALASKAISNPFTMEKASSGTGTYANQISSSLYNATDESLKNVADKLRQEPSLNHAAEELLKGIELKDEQRKNNAIFLLLQKPTARKFLNPEE